MLTIWMAGIADGKVSEHKKILNALKKKDLKEAKKMLYLHLHNLDKEEKLVKKEFSGYFLSEETRDNKFDVDFGGFPLFRKGTGVLPQNRRFRGEAPGNKFLV